MSTLEALERVELFSHLPTEDLKTVAALAVRRRVPKGQTIVSQGEMGIAFYVIERGGAEITATQEGGEERLAAIGPGAFFGEMALFENQVRSATVTALEDTDLVVITKWDFLAEVNRPGSGLAVALLAILARRIRTLDSNHHQD